MAAAEDQLPDDVNALKRLVIAERTARQTAEAHAVEEHKSRQRLERLLIELRRALYGR